MLFLVGKYRTKEGRKKITHGLSRCWPQRGAIRRSAAFPQLFRSCSAAVPLSSRSFSAAFPHSSRSFSAALPHSSRSFPAQLPQLFRTAPAAFPDGGTPMSRASPCAGQLKKGPSALHPCLKSTIRPPVSGKLFTPVPMVQSDFYVSFSTMPFRTTSISAGAVALGGDQLMI
jgi:hypothetical protein